MKTAKKVIALALALLLVTSNMAFAQNKQGLSNQKVTQKVERAKAKAVQKEKPYSVQLMEEIVAKHNKSEMIRKAAGPVGMGTGILIGIASLIAIIVSDGVLFFCAAGALGTAGAGLTGAYVSDAHDPVSYLNDSKAPVWYLSDILPSKYAKIQNALGRDILEKFSVVLVNPDQVTDDINTALLEFFSHPRRDYVAEKLKNGQYRFYFINTRRDIYADIDPQYGLIFLRQDGFSSPTKPKTAHVILSPQFKR